MSSAPITQTPAAAAKAYIDAGLILVAFDRGSKGPHHTGWNLRENCIDNETQASNLFGNIGLAHAYSRTCCIDIDDMPRAVEWCGGAGIDLKALCRDPSAVLMTSGSKYHLKLFYLLPPGVASWRMPTRADPTWPQPSTAMRTTRSDGGAKVTRSRYRLARPQNDAQTSSRTRSSNVSRRTTVRASPSATNTTAGRGTLL